MTENLHNNNQSPMEYTPLNTGYGSYGVDHSQFATQKDSFQQSNMGTIGNYVQHGSNFWQALPKNNRRFGENEIKPRYWDTAKEGKQIYEDVVAREGIVKPQRQNINNYINSAVDAYYYMDTRREKMGDKLTDKFKHALLNCKGAQYGSGGNDMATILSYGKEGQDLFEKSNTLDASWADHYANKIGRLMGTKYPTHDCDEMLQQYIKKYK